MTDQQINAAIATKLMGWKADPRCDPSCWMEWFRGKVIFSPITDANDLRLAEATLPEDRQKEYGLLMMEAIADNFGSRGPSYFYAIRQLPLRTCCEALLEAVK